MTRTAFTTSCALALLSLLYVSSSQAAECPAFLDHEFTQLHSNKKVNLCAISAGKPMLIVNTASHCGFTPQFKGLEAVHKKYADKGLVVVGFASDDFNQEAKDEAEAAEICFVNFGVTFTMLAPTAVKGTKANPVFQELGRKSGEPTWNFNKYLVSADRRMIEHFDSRVTPDSEKMIQAIERFIK